MPIEYTDAPMSIYEGSERDQKSSNCFSKAQVINPFIDLFIFAGEKSADIHGERLLLALKKKFPDLSVAGVGGPKMRAVGMQSILKMEDFQVMGFIDVFLSLPSLIRHFYTISRAIEQLNPKLVLTIDYPGFNLRLHRHLRKKGFKGKICHYICPSVWAWGKKRIPLMVQNLDLLLTILPFEKKLFENTSLPVAYVGNPLVEKIRSYAYKSIDLSKGKPIVAIFPGSRKKEIQRNLKIQLQVCKTLNAFHIAISLSDPRFAPLITSILQSQGISEDSISIIPPEHTYELMRAAHFAIAKSGTVTLELALHRVPTVVVYGISALDLFIAKDLLQIRLPYYCLVNIIAGKEVFAELIGPHFTRDSLLAEVETVLKPARYAACQKECDEVIALLGEKNTPIEATEQLSFFLQPELIGNTNWHKI
jgi:lipid-A-disaccharide synthase